jgi:tRNA-specific 2-thiouridylase
MAASPAKVLVALSGGVDSAVAAALLCEQGHDVVAATMRLPVYGPSGNETSGGESAERIESARRVAEKLGIPHRVLDLRSEFEEDVLRDFCYAYGAGRTPNPCVRCNERMKFGRLLELADELGASSLATGHYAGKALDARASRFALKAGRGRDDQSYFLHRLSQQQLCRAVFPLEGYEKPQVREMARTFGLPVHDRPKSHDLCFLPRGQYRAYLSARCPKAFRPGPIVHVSGKVLGSHDGIGGYTVGQRRRLGIARREPLYVVDIRADENAVLVGERNHLLRGSITVGEVNWIAPPPHQPLKARVRIRYNHPGAEARVLPITESRVRVEFDRPQEAPCPGQSAVFYSDDTVLGGGTIESASTGDAE